MPRSLQERARACTVTVLTVLLGALLCSASDVRAGEGEEAKRYQLRWVREGGAESCVSGAALERLLEQVLGPQPASSPASLSLEGLAQTAAEPLRYAIRVTVRDAKTGEVLGERELTTAEPKCSALTPALLLVLAMSVDPDAGRAGLPQAVTEELRRGRDEDVDVWPNAAAPATLPNGATSPPPQRSGATPARKRERLRSELPHEPARGAPSANEPRVFGALALSVGTFPALATGAQLGARVPLRRGWSLAFSALGWFPQVVALPASPYLQDDGVQLAAGQVDVALCQPLLGSRLQLGLCGGIMAGLRWVSALALSSRANPTRPFYGPMLGLDGTFRVAPSWFAHAGVTAQATAPRDRFTYVDHSQREQVWFEPSLLSGRAWLGVGAFL